VDNYELVTTRHRPNGLRHIIAHFTIGENGLFTDEDAVEIARHFCTIEQRSVTVRHARDYKTVATLTWVLKDGSPDVEVEMASSKPPKRLPGCTCSDAFLRSNSCGCPSGQVTTNIQAEMVKDECANCGGDGEIGDDIKSAPCPACDGSGFDEDVQTTATGTCDICDFEIDEGQLCSWCKTAGQ